MIKNSLFKHLSKLLLVLAVFSFCTPAFAAKLNLTYEQAVTDRYGNELGYITKTINSFNELPAGSPWRDYLSTKLQNGKTIYEYANSVSSSLSKDLHLTISDRDSNSYTSKCKHCGYGINIYKYVNNFGSSSSKAFLFLHELGHVTMLNSYPKNYDFTNLDYGSDNRHYLDEILPNHNTAWVEGWANAFGAANNNGMVFSYDLKSNESLAFLKENTFNEMVRNELFVSKMLYDMFKDIPGGQAAAYDAFARTSPHYSFLSFCQNYVKLYPNNQLAVAKLLVKNSYGKISLKELLEYVNGGSYTVSRSLYDYLSSSGMLNGTASNNYNNNNNVASGKTSFWSRITSFFARLFGKKSDTGVAASPASSTSVGTVASDEALYNQYTDGTIAISSSMVAPINSATAPNHDDNAVNLSVSGLDTASIAEVQELYYKYFAEYNALMADSDSNKADIMEARDKMIKVKDRLKKLKAGN